MIRESALTRKRQTTKSVEVPFTEIPHQAKLFLDFLQGDPSIEAFYRERKSSTDAFAKKVLNSYEINREKLCAVLRETNLSQGAGEETLRNIQRLSKDNCVAVVTGQQAGLFSGPLLTIYKAISAIKLAREFSERGIEAVPVFWIAEEDHDFEEVSATFLLDAQNHVAKVSNNPAKVATGIPVGKIECDETIEKSKAELFGLLSESAHKSEIREIVGDSYAKGATLSSAFAKIINRLFGKYGLILVSPLDSRLKKLASPLIRKAFENADELSASLKRRSESLRSSGYYPQVKFDDDQFPFFLFDDEFVRRPLRRVGADFVVKGTSQKLTRSELFDIAEHSPEHLSPSALMRPVIQDYLLPTILYVGGAAEVNYFSQSYAIYETLKRPETPIRHRASFTIVPPPIARTLEKSKLSFAEIFEGKEKVFERLIDDETPRETSAKFAMIERKFSEELDQLEDNFRLTDPTLLPTLAKRRKKILYQVEALRKKFRRAHFSRDEILRRKIENVLAVILPNGELQERSINVFSFLNLYGGEFIETVFQNARTDGNTHTILFP